MVVITNYNNDTLYCGHLFIFGCLELLRFLLWYVVDVLYFIICSSGLNIVNIITDRSIHILKITTYDSIQM